jgi:hypothetical protein
MSSAAAADVRGESMPILGLPIRETFPACCPSTTSGVTSKVRRSANASERLIFRRASPATVGL